MPLPSLSSLLAARVTDALPDHDFDPQVRRSEHADFQANGMLALGRSLGRSPRELATTVAAALPADVAPTVAGPGFINLTLTDNALLTQAAGRLADPRLGVPLPETGRVTVIDYSQPNIAKEMHVGHLRSTIIGDALARVLTRLGGTVLRQNHIGDWGTQFGMLIEYMSTSPAAPASSGGISRLAGLYRDARAAFEADPGFAARSRRRVVALQAGDAETVAAWHDIVDESTRYFTDVYDRLGVLLEPADVVGESFYNPRLPAVVDDLLAAGVAVHSDGAVCVFFDDVRGPDGEPVPLLVRKSDGGFGYAATDLAAVRHRVTALRADRVLYVVDARQALHFRMVFDTARRAGWIPAGVTVTHVPFGLMLGSDGKPFRTRYGGTARLTDLVDDAVAGAREVVAAKNPALDAATVDERAREVGVGALKYADLATNRARDYVYDPARMLSLTGNTSVYLQFAHARARSILARAGADGEIDTGLPLEPAERALILDLDAFGDVVAEVGATLEPHRLCGYLFRLAQSLTTFLETCPVLRAPSPVRENRLALCRLAAETMRAGLDLSGIASPDRL
ncbi:arginine--tRNA ligase [Virgisporangium aurantiacum]|uniref:Arginine--tRNA ligase n=1 Tax=Virgisporangium aurantiacum TaxID=175570 RepID=A0A8J3ZH41_9ACTN|nr:arginine--tRNA ligase [Virgisporangium aurantiacum]GIJ62703.1 arginine--tRNA ligase [Virgisporangium aurantiacum]